MYFLNSIKDYINMLTCTNEREILEGWRWEGASIKISQREGYDRCYQEFAFSHI